MQTFPIALSITSPSHAIMQSYHTSEDDQPEGVRRYEAEECADGAGRCEEGSRFAIEIY